MSAMLSIDLTIITGDTIEEHLGTKVLAVLNMEASPSVIAALLRKAADDIDPPRTMRLPHGDTPGARGGLTTAPSV